MEEKVWRCSDSTFTVLIMQKGIGFYCFLLVCGRRSANELSKNTARYYNKVYLCGMTLELPKVARSHFWLTTTSLLWLCTIVLCTFTYYRQCMKCSCVYSRQQHQAFLSAGHAADKDSQHADPNTEKFVPVTPRKYLDCKPKLMRMF
jgi:hypothetical protein